MRPTDYIWWAWKSLKQHRIRTILTALGIIIGIAAIISLQAVGRGFQEAIFEQIFKLNPDTIFVIPRLGPLSEVDVARIQNIEGIDKVAPIISGAIQVSGTSGTRTFDLVGVKPEDLPTLIRGAEIRAGRIFSGDSEALVGYKVANPPDLPFSFLNVGSTVIVRTIDIEGNTRQGTLRIVGMYEPIGASMFFDPDRTVFVNIDTARNLLGQKGFNVVLVLVSNVDEMDIVSKRIITLLGKKVEVFTASQVRKVYDNISNQINTFLAGIAFISLIVAGVGITNIMLISVIERTREIGVLKALGFTNKNVLAMFLSEAVTIGMIGALIGVISGVVLAYLSSSFLSFTFSGQYISGFVKAKPHFEIYSFVMAVFFGFLVSLASGFYPAYRAAKMDPVVAIRYE